MAHGLPTLCITVSHLRTPSTRRNGARNSGISGRPEGSRLRNISKFPTRIARHGQRATDGPSIPWNRKREAAVGDILPHSSFQALHTTDGDLRQITSDAEAREEKRAYARYGQTTSIYVVGVYNGHTSPMGENPIDTPILKPTVYFRATSWGPTVQILKACIRSMSRNDVHLVPLNMSARHHAYLAPSSGKTHVVTGDGVMDSSTGIKFLEIENGVIITLGIDGLIPPCCITGVWPNANVGILCLDISEDKPNPPRVAPMTEMPDQGPPRYSMIQRVRGESRMRQTQCQSETYSDEYPEIPHVASTPSKPRLSRSPTPSKPSFPENGPPHPPCDPPGGQIVVRRAAATA